VHRQDLVDFFSLATIQGSSAALPLLIFPLPRRVLSWYEGI